MDDTKYTKPKDGPNVNERPRGLLTPPTAANRMGGTAGFVD